MSTAPRSKPQGGREDAGPARGKGGVQAQEIRGAVRRRRRQYRAVHRRPQRQRPALPRLRHPGRRRHLRVRGNRPPAGPRQAADQGRTEGLQGKLRSLRGLPVQLQLALEALPAASHPMDVMRTAVSVLGCVLPKDDHNLPGARDIADRLMANLGSACCTGTTTATTAAPSTCRPTTTASAAISCTCCTAKPSEEWVRAMHISLNLYAEHEFNASTFTGRVIAGTGSDIYSAITGAIGALRGPSTAAPTKSRSKCRSATRPPTRPRPTSAAASRPRKS